MYECMYIYKHKDMQIYGNVGIMKNTQKIYKKYIQNV